MQALVSAIISELSVWNVAHLTVKVGFYLSLIACSYSIGVACICDFLFAVMCFVCDREKKSSVLEVNLDLNSVSRRLSCNQLDKLNRKSNCCLI